LTTTKAPVSIESNFSSQVRFENKKEEKKENVAMSVSTEPWLDRWWPLLVILYGVMFITLLVTFSPVN
jgi:hypothetical protein